MVVLAQTVKEYTGKVDDLLAARKDNEAAKDAETKKVQAQEAQRNAYATLMPLALPSAPQQGAPGYSGGF
eukprot:356995-Chlamydomonas_euryale.AAC.15